MPYVPSKKTDGQSTDREVIDAVLEPLVKSVAAEITNNFSLRPIYERIFTRTAFYLRDMFKSPGLANSGQTGLIWNLARAIYKTGAKYGYEGAYLGEFNYAFTRFIQLVPQEKVRRGDWKDELRYWLYAETVTALRHAENETENLDIGVDGVFQDIKDEYKWRVNRSYETAQILKSGDCYDTPHYNKPLALVYESGEVAGYIYIDVKRSKETLNLDLFNYQIVLKKKNL